jgi:choline-sulfatase
LTGREARNAGGWQNYSLLKPGLETIAGALSTAGYETCLQGKMHLGGDRQFAGFDHRPYGDLTGEGGHQADPPAAGLETGKRGQSRIRDTGVTGIPESHLQETNAARETISWIREQRHSSPDRPWFVTVSFSRPHWPRTAPHRHIDRYPPEEVPEPRVGPTDADEHPYVRAMRDRYELDDIELDDKEQARAAYFACVDFLDEIIGDLLGTLERDGALDDTITIYIGDHGELAGEHGLWEKRSWHEGSIRVPWMIQLPEHRTGAADPATIESPVSLIDLLPTVCGLTGSAIPEGVDGVDLSDAVREGAEPDRGPVFCDYLHPDVGGLRYRVAIDDRLKYVRFQDAPDRLYDLAEDPLERRDLSTGEYSTQTSRLQDLVDETMDFEAAADAAEQDLAMAERHKLGVPAGTGNTYYLPDGRIVDADSILYQPHVLVKDPEVVFEDHP